MMRGAFFVLILAVAASTAGAAERRRGAPPSTRSIEPVNVYVPFVVVSGTVTVRARGLIVSPADVTYSFQPPFKNSAGYLNQIGDGLYSLEVGDVPANSAYTLTIKSAYNDTVVKEGRVERMGRTYGGTLRIEIPPGRDFSFGDQILDLN